VRAHPVVRRRHDCLRLPLTHLRGFPMQTIKFQSFGREATGRILTGNHSVLIVSARNPYGGHNLCVVDAESYRAIRHGNQAATNWSPSIKAYRKVRAYIENRLRRAKVPQA